MSEWNIEKLESTGLMNVLCKMKQVDYELQNCVRGSYTECDTYDGLAKRLFDLSEELNRCAADVLMIDEDKWEDDGE
jgi:hypothetical protein